MTTFFGQKRSTGKYKTWRLPLMSTMMDPKFQMVTKKPQVILYLMSTWHLSEKIVGLNMVIIILKLSGPPFIEMCLERALVSHQHVLIWMMFPSALVIFRMYIYKWPLLKNTMLFVVQSLHYRIWVSMQYYFVLSMSINLLELTIGDMLAVLWKR